MDPLSSQPILDLNSILISKEECHYEEYIEKSFTKAIEIANTIFQEQVYSNVSNAFKPELLIDRLVLDVGASPMYRRKLVTEYQQKIQPQNLINNLMFLFNKYWSKEQLNEQKSTEEKLKELEQKKSELQILKSRFFKQELSKLSSYNEAVAAFPVIEETCRALTTSGSKNLQEKVQKAAKEAINHKLIESGEFSDPVTKKLLENPTYVSFKEFPDVLEILDSSTATKEQIYHHDLEQSVSPSKTTRAFDVELDLLNKQCELIEKAIQDAEKRTYQFLESENVNVNPDEELTEAKQEVDLVVSKDPSAVLDALWSILKKKQQEGALVLEEYLETLKKTFDFRGDFEKLYLANLNTSVLLNEKHPIYKKIQETKIRCIEFGFDLLTYQRFLEDETVEKIVEFMGLPPNSRISPKALKWEKVTVLSRSKE